jgi:hypothetical protein
MRMSFQQREYKPYVKAYIMEEETVIALDLMFLSRTMTFCILQIGRKGIEGLRGTRMESWDNTPSIQYLRISLIEILR